MISTNINVRVETFPRKAGIESGRLFNDWLDCRFEIQPSLSRHFKWTVHYKALDTASDAGGFPATDTFTGFGETRPHAHKLMLHVTTHRIHAVVEARKQYLRRRLIDAKLSIEADMTLAEPPLLRAGVHVPAGVGLLLDDHG